MAALSTNRAAAIADVATTESVLGEISNQVQPAPTVILANVNEQSPDVIDTAAARLGGEVTRRPLFDVEQEIAAAQDAQRPAERPRVRVAVAEQERDLARRHSTATR